MKPKPQSLDIALLSSEALHALAELVKKREEIDTEIESLLEDHPVSQGSSASRAAIGMLSRQFRDRNRVGGPSRRDVGKVGDRPKMAGRGELSHMIVQAIRDAGEAGISVPEIAKVTGRTLSNVHNWMSSTAKNLDPREFGTIEKIGPGLYRASSDPTEPNRVVRRRRALGRDFGNLR